MFPKTNFQLSDSNYNDTIETHPFHFNSMREKPIYPIALLETNISSLRPFPDNWVKSKNEWRYFRDDRKFAKRTLFNANDIDQKIHLATLSSLTNQHLLDPNVKFPHEDDVYRAIGQKRVILNRRNSLKEISPGDKNYRVPEYSTEFFHKSNRNWRSEKYELPKKSDEPLSKDLLNLLNMDSSSNVFTSKYDFGYETDPKLEKNEEILTVRSLNTWRAAPKLELPFKVLDLPDKTMKYRPKVTR